MRRTILILTLTLPECSGERFERDLFTGGAAGESGEGGSGGEAGDAGGDAGAAGAAGSMADPCAACQCNGPNELCPVDPQWHCQGEPNKSCCSCPPECLLPKQGCTFYPTSKMWCCP